MKIKRDIDLNDGIILITGAAGFIGANLVLRLLHELKGTHIIGVDNLNEYYDVNLKKYRLQQIAEEAKKQQEKQIYQIATW